MADQLTARESQIAELVARAASNKEIASEMRLSEQTVKNALSRAFRKLAVSNRVGLVLKLNPMANTMTSRKERV